MSQTDALDCFARQSPAPREVLLVRAGKAALDAVAPNDRAFAEVAGFKGKAGQVLLLPDQASGARAIAAYDPDSRDALRFATLATKLGPGDWQARWHDEPDAGDASDLVLGFAMGAYRIRRASPARVRLVLPDGADRGLALARACWFGRDLINEPPNRLGPVELAEAGAAMLRALGGDVAIVSGEALDADYPCLAHVAHGSDRPGRVLQASWSGSGASEASPHFALVGKGVCFDTGGYDIKPASGMLRMKKDMGGAALVLALAQAVIVQDLPVRLTIRIGCVENSISGRAMRPSDVVRTRAGHEVEIGNTDAEGRLVLCDLLAEMSELGPDRIINAATLTGAARVALGPDLPAIFSNDQDFADAILESGKCVADDMWQMPLWHGYSAWLDSNCADFGNVSAKPMAGAITAALFLEKFVDPAISWAHIDTYAWNDASRPGRPEGGETLGLRCLFDTMLKSVNIQERHV